MTENTLGQEPPLEHQWRYYLARRDLMRRVAAEGGDVEAIEAYGEADRELVRLGKRMRETWDA